MCLIEKRDREKIGDATFFGRPKFHKFFILFNLNFNIGVV
jgi:hypothetical protein